MADWVMPASDRLAGDCLKDGMVPLPQLSGLAYCILKYVPGTQLSVAANTWTTIQFNQAFGDGLYITSPTPASLWTTTQRDRFVIPYDGFYVTGFSFALQTLLTVGPWNCLAIIQVSTWPANAVVRGLRSTVSSTRHNSVSTAGWMTANSQVIPYMFHDCAAAKMLMSSPTAPNQTQGPVAWIFRVA